MKNSFRCLVINICLFLENLTKSHATTTSTVDTNNTNNANNATVPVVADDIDYTLIHVIGGVFAVLVFTVLFSLYGVDQCRERRKKKQKLEEPSNPDQCVDSSPVASSSVVLNVNAPEDSTLEPGTSNPTFDNSENTRVVTNQE